MKQRAIDDAIPLKKDGDEKPDLVIEAKKLVDSKSKSKKLFLTDYEKNKLKLHSDKLWSQLAEIASITYLYLFVR